MSRVALDTNILLLLLIGQVMVKVANKRLRQYTDEDFAILASCLDARDRIVVTPHVLTEVSNIADYGLDGRWRLAIPDAIALMAGDALEIYAPSKDITLDPEFPRLGLADCAWLACLDTTTTFITDDLALFNASVSRGLKSINFTHLRNFD